MMVSKVAVIALVAVVAVPILLGYALNLTETTETDYRSKDDFVNVTPLLQNGTGYTYAHGDTYQINSTFLEGNIQQYPDYVKISGARTSTKGDIAYASGHNVLPGSSAYGVNVYTLLYYQADYTPSVGSVTMNFQTYSGGVYTNVSVANFHSANYDYDTQKWIVVHYTSDTSVAQTSYDNFHHVVGFTPTAGYTGMMYVFFSENGVNKYVDVSAGYRFRNNWGNGSVRLPDNTRDVLFTINLNSITDANYSLLISTQYMDYLNKTTIDGVPHWQIVSGVDPSVYHDLYYDPTRSDNTYQFKISIDKIYDDDTLSYYNHHTEARYVGSWPTLIGEANAYQEYSYDFTFSVSIGTPINFKVIGFNSDTKNYPIMRVDDALFRAFEYSVISNQEYKPANFRSNPVTTISDTTRYGTSLQFGGNTYTVSDGKITLDGHRIPVNNLTFSSVLNSDGDYDNKIGNTLISTTAQPSTILFDGIWATSVSTASMETYTYTKTEWDAGSFGWDGVDHNFLIVGLITCLGVFVGLGIYARKSHSGGIIPLMIVTGCAAAVFFIML